MPMLVIAGTYRILNASPDGDSVRFYPDDPVDWEEVEGSHRVETNSAGGAQLRMDGIDALETHYAPGTNGLGVLRQPPRFGDAAANELLTWLGFTDVTWSTTHRVTASVPQQVPGYIMTRSADAYGRCVAFAFKGAAPTASATSWRLDVPLLRQSANFHLLEKGLVYPTYYRKLFWDLRDEMTRAVRAARPSRGLWSHDVSQTGFGYVDLATVTQNEVILPKLFRRLVDYIALNDGSSSLAGFKSYLATRDDRISIIPNAQWTGFDTIVDVDGQNVSLNRQPEEIVFDEK